VKGHTNNRPEGHLNKAQAAEVLRVTKRTVDNWMRRGFIPYYRIGRMISFRREDLLKAIESCRVPAAWEKRPNDPSSATAAGDGGCLQQNSPNNQIGPTAKRGGGSLQRRG